MSLNGRERAGAFWEVAETIQFTPARAFRLFLNSSYYHSFCSEIQSKLKKSD